MESGSYETEDIILGYVIPLMKLKIKNLKFPIKTILQALGQSDSKFWLTSLWTEFGINGRLRLIGSMSYVIKFLTRTHIVAITTLNCVLVFSVVFLYYLRHTCVIAPGCLGGFQPLTIF